VFWQSQRSLANEFGVSHCLICACAGSDPAVAFGFCGLCGHTPESTQKYALRN
jgi:hypothetical protein